MSKSALQLDVRDPAERSELLSAYLDGELAAEEEERVEELLDERPEMRAELDGMRRVIGHLRHVERVAPPQTLDMAVTRRIALDGDRRSLLDRVEDGMTGIGGGKQSHIFSMFALVIALVAIVYFFAQGVHDAGRGLIPVIFDEPPAMQDADLETARQVVVAGSLFRRHDDEHEGALWVEDGVAPDAEAELVLLGSERGERLLEEHPELHGVALLGHVKVRVDGEVVELLDPAGVSPADVGE